jgi:hypothetical protein
MSASRAWAAATAVLVVFLSMPALSAAASFVGTQTGPTEWTYTLTYDPLDNYAVCPTPGIATITLSALDGVVRATQPTSTDFANPDIDLLNQQWVPQVSSDGRSVTWTHLGPGTGNFGVAKHVYGFKLYTAFLATSGPVSVASSGFSIDVSVIGPCPVQPADSRDFTGTTQGPVSSVAGQLDALHSAVNGVGPGTSLGDKVRDAQFDLAVGDTFDACAVLRAFVAEVQAQAGKSIPSATAAALVHAADQIRVELGC